MSSLSLITCTGGRPEAFALLEGWIADQNFHGAVQWIVVDDVEPATPTHLCQTVIRPKPFWKPGTENTLARNLLAGLEAVKAERVLFIEDDEAYLPGYLANMDAMLDEAAVCGQMNSRYYHVGSRRYRTLENRQHASLCQTGIRADVIPRLQQICREGSLGIDLRLWHAPGSLSHESDVVSMKGLPGRPGIGIGHRPAGSSWRVDVDGIVLREWLGEHGARKYANFVL